MQTEEIEKEAIAKYFYCMSLYLGLCTGHVNAHKRSLRTPPLSITGHVPSTTTPTSSSASTHREASLSPGRLFRGIFLT